MISASRHRGLVIFISAIAIAAGIAVRADQARDQSRAASATGTARVDGVVMETDNRPIRRVIVTLTGSEVPAGRTAISDDDGRFAFDGLPAGRFTISATKPAYIPGEYGAVRPGRAGIPLQLRAGERVTDVRLTLYHGAAIAGAIRDVTGEPMANTQICAFRVPPAGTSSIAELAGIAMTDDRGAYRLFGLLPGDYLVAAASRTNATTADVLSMSDAQVDAELRDLQRRRGASTSSSPPPAAIPAASIVPPGSYAIAPVFYPGTASTANAMKISLAAGDDRPGVDFTVQFVRMASIQGTVVMPAGTGEIQFTINRDGLQPRSLIGSTPVFSSQASASGRTFKYTNVAPGHYVIAVRAASPSVLWARGEVDVTGADATGMELVLQPAMRLSGRLVFDGAMLTPPANLGTVQVSLTANNDRGSSAAGTTQMGNFYVPPAVVQPDGRFEIGGIIPDSYKLSNLPPPAGWTARQFIVNGRDILDLPLDVAAGANITGAVLTFSDRHTVLSGTLVTGAGQPAPAYFIAVFPADRALWRPRARRIQSVRAGTDGRWIVRDLPAGDYLVAALADLDPDDLLDSAFLDKLTGFAAKVSIRDGDDKTLDLRIGGL